MNSKHVPDKCCLVRLVQDFQYGIYHFKKDEIGVFLEYSEMDLKQGQTSSSIIVEFFHIYVRGIKIAVPRYDFEII
jgi:hypothetical protein